MDSKVYIYLAIAVVYYLFKYYKKTKKIEPNEMAENKEVKINQPQKNKNKNVVSSKTNIDKNEIENKETYEIATTKLQVENSKPKVNNNTQQQKSSLQNQERLKNLTELKRAFIYSEIFKTKF